MLILVIVREQQPDIYQIFDRLWGPFLRFDEWEKIMQEPPRPG